MKVCDLPFSHQDLHRHNPSLNNYIDESGMQIQSSIGRNGNMVDLWQ
jgi:hypothetical protein